MSDHETSIRMPVPEFLDLDTLETIPFPVRPLGFRRQFQNRWDQPNPHASSISPVHYSGSSNQTISLEFSTLIRTVGEYQTIDDFVRFLESACAPSIAGAATLFERARPSRYLLTWPGELALECVVTEFSDSADRFFTSDGKVRSRSISMTLLEVPAGKGVLDKTNVRAYGSIRTWQGI